MIDVITKAHMLDCPRCAAENSCFPLPERSPEAGPGEPLAGCRTFQCFKCNTIFARFMPKTLRDMWSPYTDFNKKKTDIIVKTSATGKKVGGRKVVRVKSGGRTTSGTKYKNLREKRRRRVTASLDDIVAVSEEQREVGGCTLEEKNLELTQEGDKNE